MVDFNDTEQGDEDPEFGAPESGPIDLNRQINHAMASLTNALGREAWKVGQHAAEVDYWKEQYAEKEAEAEALNAALQAEMEHSRKLEGLLEREGGVTLATRAGDHQREDAFLAAVVGRPGLGGDEQ